MKITIPESIADVTLKQFMEYSKLIERTDISEFQMNKRLIHIFCGVPKQQLDNIDAQDFDSLIEDIKKAINQEAEFVNTFEMGGVEYGFIPNFDKLTAKEFFDISLYSGDEKEMQENLNKIMAILFRPIINKDKFNNYKIESYNGTSKYADDMMLMPMNVVNGALVFFSTLAKELRISIQKYTNQVEQEKDRMLRTISQNGVGMQH